MSTSAARIAVASALVAATLAPSAAAMPRPNAPVRYEGQTRHGDAISFALSGSRIAAVRGSVPTVCVPIHGTPIAGKDVFDPPGTFALGKTGTVTVVRKNYLGVTSDVTKTFAISAMRGARGRITGRLHVDYSYLQVLFTYPISSRSYVCIGDTTFTAAPRR